MRLRYYLRGIGIGMAVTAMILHFSVNAAEPQMTDAEVIERAKALGMIENIVLAENDPTISENNGFADASSDTESSREDAQDVHSGENDPSENDILSAGNETEADSEDDIPSAGNETEADSEDLQEGMTGNGDMTESGNVQEYITITIVGGDSSVSVAGRLAEAGLVSSGEEYDAYLCANGYDRRICTGEHKIPVGATEKEIAEIITTRQ